MALTIAVDFNNFLLSVLALIKDQNE